MTDIGSTPTVTPTADQLFDTAVALAGVTPPTRNRKMVVVGDSISGQGGLVVGNGNIQSRAFFGWANAMLGAPYEMTNLGVAGETSAQIFARIDDALAENAGLYVYQAGTNDLNTSVPAATIIASQYATLKALVGTGALVVFLTTHMSSMAAGEPKDYNDLLDWQRTVASAIPGVLIVDAARILMDATGITSTTQMLVDGVHLTANSAIRIGKAMADAIRPFAPAPRPWLHYASHRLYSYSSPKMVGSNASGGNGTYFQTGITGVGSDGIWCTQLAGGTAVMSKVTPDVSKPYAVSALRATTTITSDSDGVAIRFGSSPVNGQTKFSTVWTASSSTQIGRRRTPTVPNGCIYRALVGGTSGGTEPAWPTTYGDTIVDGSVTWLCQKLPVAGDIYQAFVDFEISGVAAGNWIAPYVGLSAGDTGGGSIGALYGGMFVPADGAACVGLNGRMTLMSPPLTLAAPAPTKVVDGIEASLQVIAKAGANPIIDVYHCEIVRIG